MSANSSELLECIDQGDPYRFLRVYFQLIEQGQALSIPSSRDFKAAREAWSDIVLTISEGSYDEFLDQLTRYWVEVLKKQGGVITEQFAKDILAIIDQRVRPGAIETPPLTDKVQVSTAAPVAPLLSTDYQQLKAFLPNTKDEAVAALKEALNKNKPEVFLRLYVAMCTYYEGFALPLSSSHGVIASKWDDIMAKQFAWVLPESFNKALTQLWFEVVSKNGLPSSNPTLMQILRHLDDLQPSSKQPGMGKKKKELSWFSKILLWFFTVEKKK